jgi:hypothetical protein|tara:strand:+ start:182 stop:853 length:672 start_codon:yes stop_codon:yes gene_type:complete
LKVLEENGIRYDIFLHTYNLKLLNCQRSNERNIKLNEHEWKLLQPDYFDIDSQEAFDQTIDYPAIMTHGDPWFTGGENVRNLCRQLNSCKRVFNLIEKDYQCYLFIRPDMKYTALDINAIQEILLDQHSNSIYMSGHGRMNNVSDRFYFANQKTMQIVANRLDDFKEYTKKQAPHSETFLGDLIKKHYINVRTLHMKSVRVRANGIHCQADVDSLDEHCDVIF